MAPLPEDRDVRAVDALLLRVALGATEDAAAAWATIRSRFTTADIDDGRVHPLLPLVGEALVIAGVEDPQLGMMRGVRRHTFVAQQLLLADLAAALEVISARGVRAMLIGGVPLALLHYPDRSLRSTTDADVVVSVDAVDGVDGLVAALEDEGWRAGAKPPRDLTRRVSSLRLVAPDERCTLVLHWRLVPWLRDGDGVGVQWDRAGACAVEGREVRAAGVDDLLLHVLTRAFRLGWGTEPRWIADLVLLLRSAGSTVDWDAWIGRVERGGLLAPVRDAFACAAAIVDVPLPAEVRGALGSARVERGVARRYAAARRPMLGVRGRVPGHDLVVEWHRQTFNLDGSTRARRMVPFVLGRTDADHVWSVPAAVVRHRRGHA